MTDEIIQTSILKTLCYADVFHYPLTFSELWRYLIAPFPISKQDLREVLEQDYRWGERRGNFYFLKGRSEIVGRRKKRMWYSKRKMVKARNAARLLSFIPTIKMIAVSGSLAMDNSRQGDDIDFFIITRPHSLWITRLLVFTVLFLARRLRRKGKPERDTICPNMFVSSDHMAIGEGERDLFVAHEIAQLKMLLNREAIYERFLIENLWIVRFLPHTLSISSLAQRIPNRRGKTSYARWFVGHLIHGVLYHIDSLCFFLQMWYMKGHMTNEKVSQHIAKFHPLKRGERVISAYKEKFESIQWVLERVTEEEKNQLEVNSISRDYSLPPLYYGILTWFVILLYITSRF